WPPRPTTPCWPASPWVTPMRLLRSSGATRAGSTDWPGRWSATPAWRRTWPRRPSSGPGATPRRTTRAGARYIRGCWSSPATWPLTPCACAGPSPSIQRCSARSTCGRRRPEGRKRQPRPAPRCATYVPRSTTCPPNSGRRSSSPACAGARRPRSVRSSPSRSARPRPGSGPGCRRSGPPWPGGAPTS
ncbi:MAG: hypothetical protein AVDCRST_MAG10-1627, partial [uncultured Acidimicrobiales bacterium]